MGQKVLVIGSGAREHTIAYTLLKAPSIDEVTVAPGNPGMLKDGIHTTQLSQSNHAALIEFVKNNGYDWVFVGPEVPLIQGIVDDFAAAGIKAFGPSKAAAQIEGSKDFAKQLMDRHNIPTAQYKTFSDLEMAQDYVHEHGAPIVIKADGLAAGKGVTVAMDEHTAQRALEDIFIDHRFGSAGAKVVIEDFLDGQEFSLMSFVNGTDFWPMPISQDHKRAHDGDEGPNTGGMGAYSPVPQIPQSVVDEAIEKIVRPTVEGMAEEGTPVHRYPVRRSDRHRRRPEGHRIQRPLRRPETEVVLLKLTSDLGAGISAILDGETPNSPGMSPTPPSAWSSPPTATRRTSSRVPVCPKSKSTRIRTSTTPVSPLTSTVTLWPTLAACCSSKPPLRTSSPPRTRSTQSSTSSSCADCFTATTSASKP